MDFECPLQMNISSVQLDEIRSDLVHKRYLLIISIDHIQFQ